MEINVLDKEFNLVAVIDDFTSLMCCKRYYDVGALDLQIEATAKNVEVFKKGYYITRNDDDVAYQIKAIEIDTKSEAGNYLIIGAIDCKNILSQRIIWKTINFNGSVGNFIQQIIKENVVSPALKSRKINNFYVKDLQKFLNKISQQVSYDNLQTKIIEVCKTYKLGWKITLENGKFYFDLYEGKNRSINQTENNPVIFSSEYDNLENSKYKLDSTEFKNSALIGGEGEGINRKFANIGDSQGLDRFEIFVDAKELTTNTDSVISDAQYLQLLSSKGYEELAKKSTDIFFESEIDFNSYKYKIDYELGDIITIQNEYGISADARITEIIETWDEDGFTLEPKFEHTEFEIEYIPVKTELEKTESVFENKTDELIFYRKDYPLGLTIEMFGGKGENGQSGESFNYYEIAPNADPYKALDIQNHKSYLFNQGGLGGRLGDDLTIEFTIDGEPYTAKAVGGYGGGGGGGAGIMFKKFKRKEGLTNTNYYALKPDTDTPYAGGKGGFGNGLVFNIIDFEDKVVIKKINFTRANDTRSQSGSVGSNAGLNVLDVQSGKGYYRYANSGYGGFSDGVTGGGGSNSGKDSTTVRTGEWTDFPEYIVSVATDEKNHVLNVYKIVDTSDNSISGALLSEASVMMLSERGINLLSENSTSTTGIKISELEETNDLYDGCCLPIVQNGETKKVTYSTIKNKVRPDFKIDENGHLIAIYN